MKMLTKARNRVNDLIHKATSLIKKEFPGAKAYVGKPFNDGARKLGRVWAQQVSQASNRKIINQLDYKMGGAIQIEEHYTSKTCPVCGVRKKSLIKYFRPVRKLKGLNSSGGHPASSSLGAIQARNPQLSG